MSSTDLRSKLGRARGLGSAKHGVGHWWMQRVTAIALAPLTLWFAFSLLTAMLSPEVLNVAQWFASPVNSVLMVVMLAALFWHAKLGMQVVIEDYVKDGFSKYLLLLSNTFACSMFAALSVLAVLKLHFLDVVASTM